MEQLEDYLKNLIKENKKVHKIKLFTINSAIENTCDSVPFIRSIDPSGLGKRLINQIVIMDKNGNIVFTNDIDEANVNKTIARGKSEGFEMFEQNYMKIYSCEIGIILCKDVKKWKNQNLSQGIKLE